MAEKQLNIRIQTKRDTSTNWAKVQSTFIPKSGEPIFYTDLNKIKIGDGTKTLAQLEFIVGENGEFLPLTGGTITGPISLDMNSDAAITSDSGALNISPYNVSAMSADFGQVTVTTVPDEDNGVTNKKYVDDAIAEAVAADKNQTIKGNGTAFEDNDAIDIVPGANVTVTADQINKRITIASSYTDTNQKVAANSASGTAVTFGNNATVNFVGSGATSVVADSSNDTITISSTDTNTSHTHTVGAGLAVEGSGGTSGTTTYKAKLQSETAGASKAAAFSSGVLRPVGVDSEGNLAVSVPDVPTVNNGTLTMQVEGTTKTIFTANQSEAVTFNVTAADLNLPDIMHFKGVVDTLPAVTGYNVGDVIVVKSTGKEYVLAIENDTKKWIELGDEGSYALKTIKIQAGSGLTVSSGGTLASDTTIAHGDTSSAESVTASSRQYINAVTLDEFGHVTALGTATETVVDTNQKIKSGSSTFGDNAAIDIIGGTNVTVTPVTTAGSESITIAATDTKSIAASGSGFKFTTSNSIQTLDWDTNVVLVLDGGTSTQTI